MSISLTDVVDSKYNVRSGFMQDVVDELADSIQEEGLCNRVVLRKTEDGKYEVLAGSRRVKALKLLRGEDGVVDTSEYVIRDVDDYNAVRISITENSHRSNLSALDMAQAVKQIREVKTDVKNKEIAQLLWIPEAQVKRLTSLLEDYNGDSIPLLVIKELEAPMESQPIFTDKHWDNVKKHTDGMELEKQQVEEICMYIMDNEVPASKVEEAVSRVIKPVKEESETEDSEPEKEDPFKEKYKGQLVLKEKDDGSQEIYVRGKKEDTVLPIQMLLDYLKHPEQFSVMINATIEVKIKEDPNSQQ